jgi:hypothetical protein
MRGLEFFASEDNLNLLSASQLMLLAAKTGVENLKVTYATLVVWPSNLLLSAKQVK